MKRRQSSLFVLRPFLPQKGYVCFMVNDNELRRGNLLLHNPKLKNSTTTIPPTIIEVEAVFAGRIAYIAPGVEHRSEPFEDDVMAFQSRLLSLEECEPVLLTGQLLEACGYAVTGNGSYSNAPHLRLQSQKESYYLVDGQDCINRHYPLKHLHQLQNLHFALTGKELAVNASVPV